MNTTLSQNQSESNGGTWHGFYVLPVLISLHLVVIFKLFRRHRHHTEPIHIYEFNILTDMTVWFSTFFLGNFESNFEGWAPYCVLVNFVDTSARISGYADISVSQVDRFLALFWNSEYKERVTMSSAITTTVIVKILVMICTFLIYSVDPDILKCAPDILPICAYIRKNNFYWVTLPMCSSYLVVLIVTVYVIKIIIKQENIVVSAKLPSYKEERVFTITGKNQNIQPNPKHEQSSSREDQEMKTYENQNIQYHQNVSLKKHLRHPELESQRLDFARLRFVRQSTHVSIHLLKSSLDPVEQQIKHDKYPQLYTNRAGEPDAQNKNENEERHLLPDVSAGFV